MADIAAGNVTYTPGVDSIDRRLEGRPPHYETKITVSFGNGVLTYPTGGIPLTASKLGMPQGQLDWVDIADQAAAVAAGVLWEYSSSAKTLRGFSAIGTELTGGATAVAATTLILVAHGY